MNIHKIILFILLTIYSANSYAETSYDKYRRKLEETATRFTRQYLLNVSFDPTRNLFKEINDEFSNIHLENTKNKLYVYMSHGGSGKQARSILDGLGAEVATLALSSDVDALARKGYVKQDWRNEFPNNSSPYSSTIIFLVRKNNPKNITDWKDLIRDDVQVITPNPKTSGGARWNYLAAWAYAIETLQNTFRAEDFITKLYQNVPILDTSARNSTISFVRREIGDVLISWESEAYLAIEELGDDKFDIIYPSISIKAELPVAIIEKVTKRRNNRELSQKYLDFLYSKKGQKIIAENHYRPIDSGIADQYQKKFPKMKLIKVEEIGTWEDINYLHFGNRGVFDKIYRRK